VGAVDLTCGRPLADAVEQLLSGAGGDPLLVSDYDGTLAPFRKERNEAVPPPSVRRALEAILEAGGDLLILSGRRAEEVASLLGLPVEIRGCHGWERLTAEGVLNSPSLRDWESHALESLASELSGFPPPAVERKPISVALHWRGRDSVKESYDVVSDRLVRAARQAGLEVLPFNGGVEYRLPGCTKGRAMERILEERGGPVCYLGDDVTDEDAFRVLRGRGLGILVGDRARTEAELRISPGCTEAFLGLWREALTKTGAGGRRR